MAEEENWLDGICNYTGPDAKLPLGGYTKISGWAPENLVKTWSVLDAEADEGFSEKRTCSVRVRIFAVCSAWVPEPTSRLYFASGIWSCLKNIRSILKE